MTVLRRAWCVLLILEYAALRPGIALGCAVSNEGPRFDAVDCLEPRADPTAPNAGTVLLNHCDEPIAMFVAVCDLSAQPACKVDPIFSKGWRARGVEYVAPHAGMGSLETSRRVDKARSAELRSMRLTPFAPGIHKGWRAQIAACKLDLETAISQDPCVVQLSQLKRSLDASDGKSMRAALQEMRRRCSA